MANVPHTVREVAPEVEQFMPFGFRKNLRMIPFHFSFPSFSPSFSNNPFLTPWQFGVSFFQLILKIFQFDPAFLALCVPDEKLLSRAKLRDFNLF